MYIHFNGTYLKKYDTERFYAHDEDYDYTQITVNGKENQNMVQCIYILMELDSRNVILKDFTLKMKTMITLK